MIYFYKWDIIIYKSDSCGIKQGHTSRDISGVLNLKSATAGMDPDFEVRLPYGCHVGFTLKFGPYAIFLYEPCQAGNRAALSDTGDVP